MGSPRAEAESKMPKKSARETLLKRIGRRSNTFFLAERDFL
jgi:hypothetical protein